MVKSAIILVVKYTTIRSIIPHPSKLGWKLHQIYVETTFLNGKVEEEACIEHTKGFVIHGKDSHVIKLKKYIYGLKQASRAWYDRINNYLQKLGFLKSDADSKLYFKVVENQPLVLLLSVNDIFLKREEILIIEC